MFLVVDRHRNGAEETYGRTTRGLVTEERRAKPSPPRNPLDAVARELDRREEPAIGARRVDVDAGGADLHRVHRRMPVDDPLLPFACAADERASDPEEL